MNVIQKDYLKGLANLHFLREGGEWRTQWVYLTPSCPYAMSVALNIESRWNEEAGEHELDFTEEKQFEIMFMVGSDINTPDEKFKVLHDGLPEASYGSGPAVQYRFWADDVDCMTRIRGIHNIWSNWCDDWLRNNPTLAIPKPPVPLVAGVRRIKL